MGNTGEQREGAGRAGSGGSGVVMELLLRLAGVTSSTFMSSSLSSLRLAVSLAGGLLFPLGAITTETTKRTETTKTTKATATTKTTDTQIIRRREGDDI